MRDSQFCRRLTMRIIYFLSFGLVASFSGKTAVNQHVVSVGESRSDVLAKFSLATTGFLASSILPAQARGRATLDQSYDRYTPRILAGGEFYAQDLRRMIEKSDWDGIKTATAEPPKKSKADRSKADGGVADRAAKAGGFSDARVLSAADLYASAFSDNSISGKTKAMRQHVEALRDVVQKMNIASREALGEDLGGGGMFGLGGKKSSPSELSQQVKELYVLGGNEWNQFIYAANDELPLRFNKLPFLQ